MNDPHPLRDPGLRGGVGMNKDDFSIRSYSWWRFVVTRYRRTTTIVFNEGWRSWGGFGVYFWRFIPVGFSFTLAVSPPDKIHFHPCTDPDAQEALRRVLIMRKALLNTAEALTAAVNSALSDAYNKSVEADRAAREKANEN